MKTFNKLDNKLEVKETVEVTQTYTIGEIDNEILRLETELGKWKDLRKEGEKKGLREVFNIPKVEEIEVKEKE